MQRDDPQAQRLIDFCKRLPLLDGEPNQAQAEVQWVLQRFQQRRDDVSEQLAGSQVHEHERPALRCEIDALEAADSVLRQLWQRRFGAALNRG
jgi:bacterioferritin (cytochrome b1)